MLRPQTGRDIVKMKLRAKEVSPYLNHSLRITVHCEDDSVEYTTIQVISVQNKSNGLFTSFTRCGDVPYEATEHTTIQALATLKKNLELVAQGTRYL